MTAALSTVLTVVPPLAGGLLIVGILWLLAAGDTAPVVASVVYALGCVLCAFTWGMRQALLATRGRLTDTLVVMGMAVLLGVMAATPFFGAIIAIPVIVLAAVHAAFVLVGGSDPGRRPRVAALLLATMAVFIVVGVVVLDGDAAFAVAAIAFAVGIGLATATLRIVDT